MPFQKRPRIDRTPALYRSPNERNGQKFGPAMSKLNERQRAVVMWLCDGGSNNFTKACREAGYTGTDDSLRVQASRMRNDPLISEAITEESKRRLAHSLPVAMGTIEAIAADRSHKDALKAATTLAAMNGVSPIALSEHKEEKTVTVNLMDDVRAAAAVLGIDPDAMMRGHMVDVTPEVPAIENNSQWQSCQIGSCKQHQSCQYSPCRVLQDDIDQELADLM